jgi:hypothetical protein
VSPPHEPRTNQASPADGASAAAHPLLQLGRLMALRREMFEARPVRGWRRGIDTYSAAIFPSVLTTAAEQFHQAHGRFPDIVHPRRYTDKIFWSKFFRPLKVPETGNKLLTASFIPEDACELIRCPPIVWHSQQARLPRGGEIEPGSYYLKASFGANMFRRVTYPISESEAEQLEREFGAHLTHSYNWWRGEWWYNAFKRELLLEKAISSAEHSTAWNVLVIAGEVRMIVAYQKLDGGKFRKTHLSPKFEPLDIPTPDPAVYELPSPAARERMFDAARAIGAPLRFARVDLLLDDEETPWLGEVTFAPGNGLTRMPDAMDLELGGHWDLRAELAQLVSNPAAASSNAPPHSPRSAR